ncbi:hypothetical protein [Bradyrhizobium sp. RDI18]|uniref:hypothetical protein n=1 Tax=Bradyrhizobium sp. RDI18 TaxID=3367400 RepID=UPI00371DB327
MGHGESLHRLYADWSGAEWQKKRAAARQQHHRILDFQEYGMSGKSLELLNEVAPDVTGGDPSGCHAARRDWPIRRYSSGGAVVSGELSPVNVSDYEGTAFARQSNGGLIPTASTLAGFIASAPDKPSFAVLTVSVTCRATPSRNYGEFGYGQVRAHG